MTSAPVVRTADRRARRRWGSFPTTADVGIWARGATVESLFEALGLGLFALMTDLRRVRRRTRRRIRATGHDPVALVVDYLTRLLLLAEIDGVVARAITVERAGRRPRVIRATVEGEPFDPRRHRPKIEVKAITRHALEIDLARGRARVIVDI